MLPQAVEKGKAAGWRPTARNVGQTTPYRQPTGTSRQKLIEQAADVLTLLAFFSLTVTERTGFGVLLQRRLEQAYGGLGNG